MLIFDRHRPSRRVFVHYVQQLGMTGYEAETFAETQAIHSYTPIHAAVIQFPLPDITFEEIVRFFRPSPADGIRSYILAVTSIPETYSRELLYEAGADDFLVKPISGNDVRQALERMRIALVFQAEQ